VFQEVWLQYEKVWGLQWVRPPQGLRGPQKKAKTYTVKAYFEHQGTSFWVLFQVPMVQKEKKGGKMHKNMG